MLRAKPETRKLYEYDLSTIVNSVGIVIRSFGRNISLKMFQNALFFIQKLQKSPKAGGSAPRLS